MKRLNMNNIRARRSGAPLGRLALVAALILPLSACNLDKLLTVVDPEVASPASLQGEAALPIIRAGAFADFQVAFSGSGASEGQVNMAGVFTDEFIYASTFPTRIQVDRREIDVFNSTMETVHRDLQRARAAAERGVEAYVEYAPNTVGHAEMANLAGFTYILFAENYCSGVPFSRLTTTGATEYGDPQTTVQILNAAVAHFDAAITAATAAGASGATQANLARIGKGRALLNLGQFAQAASAVNGVPTDFVYHVQHSTNSARQENGVHSFQWLGRRFAVSNGGAEGQNGLPFRDANDPRVPWKLGNGTTNAAFDNSPLYVANAFPTRSASTVLASGIEARLIEAEATLQTGNAAAWLAGLNAVRANPPATTYPASLFPGMNGLTPLTDPGTDAARVNLLFRERAFWMYLSSHRLGDMRRLIRQYSRTQETVFPVGQYGVWDPQKSGTYQSEVNFPIPFDEQNNTKFTQCLDRNA